MKISLVRLYNTHVSLINSNEHLGLGYLASKISSTGCEVEILDNSINSDDEISLKLSSNHNLIVCYTIDSDNIEKTIEFVKNNRNNTHVCFGGHHASMCAFEIIEDGLCDSVVIGEGEETIIELIEKIQLDVSLEDIPGIVIKRRGLPYYTGKKKSSLELSNISYPDRTVLKVLCDISNNNSARILSSRGCQFSCNFCSTPTLRNIANYDYRVRDYIDFVDEIEHIHYTYGISNFYINDDIYFSNSTISKQRAYDIAAEILKRDLKIRYKIEIRADSISESDSELLTKLKQSGLSSVFIGIESGSQKMLDYLGKKTTVAQNELAINILRKNFINYNVGRILFGPNTSWHELSESINFFNRIKATHQLLRWPELKLRVFHGTLIESELIKLSRINSKKTYLKQDYIFQNKKVGQFCNYLEFNYNVIWNKIHFHFQNRSFLNNLKNDDTLNNIIYRFFISNIQLKNNWSKDKFDAFLIKLLTDFENI